MCLSSMMEENTFSYVLPFSITYRFIGNYEGLKNLCLKDVLATIIVNIISSFTEKNRCTDYLYSEIYYLRDEYKLDVCVDV